MRCKEAATMSLDEYSDEGPWQDKLPRFRVIAPNSGPEFWLFVD